MAARSLAGSIGRFNEEQLEKLRKRPNPPPTFHQLLPTHDLDEYYRFPAACLLEYENPAAKDFLVASHTNVFEVPIDRFKLLLTADHDNPIPTLHLFFVFDGASPGVTAATFCNVMYTAYATSERDVNGEYNLLVHQLRASSRHSARQAELYYEAVAKALQDIGDSRRQIRKVLGAPAKLHVVLHQSLDREEAKFLYYYLRQRLMFPENFLGDIGHNIYEEGASNKYTDMIGAALHDLQSVHKIDVMFSFLNHNPKPPIDPKKHAPFLKIEVRRTCTPIKKPS